MRIVMGADHAGRELKDFLRRHLDREGHEVTDMGVAEDRRVDYPDFAAPVTRSILAGEQELGILICGTGLGMSLAANRVRGIRAALCTSAYMARMAREHNDANVLVLGGRVVGTGLALEILAAFLEGRFEGGRHEERLRKVETLGCAPDGTAS